MQRVVPIILWLVVIAAAVALRVEQLAKRPIHADEATGARITAQRLEDGDVRFDPKHFHGPLLTDIALPICRLRGESSWTDLTKETLRIGTLIAGVLVVLAPWFWRNRTGHAAALLAAALLATSPLLVYYSRMFIHESWLVFFGVAFVASVVWLPRWGVPGVWLGLMFATKESVAITVLAAGAAVAVVALETRDVRARLNRDGLRQFWQRYGLHVLLSLATALVVSFAFYTDGFRHPRGAVDAVRTFFVYETVGGHDKPPFYYFNLLAVPRKSGGVWWFETPVLLLAALAYAATFTRHGQLARCRGAVRFITYVAVFHFAIYSIIAYKTPWLACLPWALTCIVAAFSAPLCLRQPRPYQAAFILLLATAFHFQIRQTRFATGRYAADDRNPYAYVPTRNELEKLEPWLLQLQEVAPGKSLEPIAVIGSDYWPLPWYLRSFQHIGYWRQPPAGLDAMPVVLALPDTADAVTSALENSHVLLPRGLRSGVPLYLFVRKDVWNNWMHGHE